MACDVEESWANYAAGLEMVPVVPDDPESVAAWVEAQMAGFYDESDAPDGMRPVTEQVGRAERCRLWLLCLDGEIVGSGGLELHEGLGVLIAGEIHAAARRRGLHQAFIRYRLEQARETGMRCAVIGSRPGGPTERNALRMGFGVAYAQLGLAQGI